MQKRLAFGPQRQTSDPSTITVATAEVPEELPRGPHGEPLPKADVDIEQTGEQHVEEVATDPVEGTGDVEMQSQEQAAEVSNVAALSSASAHAPDTEGLEMQPQEQGADTLEAEGLAAAPNDEDVVRPQTAVVDVATTPAPTTPGIPQEHAEDFASAAATEEVAEPQEAEQPGPDGTATPLFDEIFAMIENNSDSHVEDPPLVSETMLAQTCNSDSRYCSLRVPMAPDGVAGAGILASSSQSSAAAPQSPPVKLVGQARELPRCVCFEHDGQDNSCLLYTSPSPRDRSLS
eukprot:9295445-Pyramimonas_sp.AAC.1